MKTTKECYDYLTNKHTRTNRNLDEKAGKGIHSRVLHYSEPKDIRPLSSFAEVKTLSGSCTLSSHFFADIRKPGEILVREVACLNCPSCSQLKFGDCTNTDMCGKPSIRLVHLKSQAPSEVRVTRDSIKLDGYRRAKRVVEGMFVGSESDVEQEPYIISIALAPEAVWSGPSSRSWMGMIKAGDRYIKARKLHRVSALVYTETDVIYYLNSEDVRVASMLGTEIELRRTSRVSLPQNRRYGFNEGEVEKLKKRVYLEPDI